MPQAYYSDGLAAKQPVNVSPHTHPYAASDHEHVDDTGWIEITEFQNGWGAYNDVFAVSGWATPAYRLLDGVVWLKGLLGNTTVVAVTGSIITQLPEGFRPELTNIFQGATGFSYDAGSGAFYVHSQRIDINAAGQIIPQYYNDRDGSTYLSISGISFIPTGT